MRLMMFYSLAAALWLPAILAAAEPPARLVVDLDQPGPPISPGFCGLSFEAQLAEAQDGVHYFRADNQALIQLFHTLGVKSLRIGGNTSDRDARRLPDRSDLDSLFGFARAAGVKVIYCLRLRQGDPQEDAETVKYILDRYGPEVDCFSIGQEPSAYPKQPVADGTRPAEGMGRKFEKFSYASYAAEWRRFAQTILAAAPNARFCGPSVHNNGDWARRFMADFSAPQWHVDLITEHLYPGGAGNKVPSPEGGRDRMLSMAFEEKDQKLWQSFVPMAQAKGRPYRLEEVNNYFNGGAAQVSDTFAAALWGLDFMHWWAAHGAAGLNFHTGDKVAAGANMHPSRYTAYFSAAHGFHVQPLGYALKAFDLGGHGRIAPIHIASDASTNLAGYAVLDESNTVDVTLINKDHGSAAKSLEIELSDGRGIARAEQMILCAPNNNIAAKDGVTIGGSGIQSDGTWNGQWSALTVTGGASVQFGIAPASAVVVRFFTPSRAP